MTEDARFEDGVERPLRLKAEDADDLNVISSLVQDAILPSNEMLWEPRRRRFSCLINRFRWEDKDAAERQGRAVERVQAVLAIDDVLRVKQQGLDVRDADTILSLLSLSFEPLEDGAGRIVMTFAGDGAAALEVEAVNVLLQDVTRPYAAPAGKSPTHPD
ncbi:MAG: DUF2948 family protein [Pseudomonadota bacterium]